MIRKKWHSLFHPILIFILAQVAWISLLSLWIYWYISNYIIFKQVEDRFYPVMAARSTNIIALVSGIILFITISFGMSLIFTYLNKQINRNRMYDNFIANITHELKSPLASIQLYIETLLHRKNLPIEKRDEFLKMILKDSERLNQLINSILEISEIEQKGAAYNFKVYKAKKIVDSYTEELMEIFKLTNNQITFKLKIPADTRFVIDINAFKMILNNIIDNAIKYSQGIPKIMFQANIVNKNLLIEISDNGIGIPKEEIKSVFKKFYRIEREDNPNVKGTGLGLYWVKEIVRFHGGKVTPRSKGLNQGSCFRIELPIYLENKNQYLKKLLAMTHKFKSKRNN